MLSLTANDIMTRDVVTIRKGSSIEEALKKMANNNVSGLPVIDPDGCLEGIITESDLLLKGQIVPSDAYANRNAIFASHADGVDEAYRRAQSTLVEEAMTKKVLTFTEESLVVDIARAMIEHAVNRFPIVRNCKVIGIVSRKDIISALAKETTAMRGSTGNQHGGGQMIEL
ncbi:MAG: CBS domain-containing protein [Armatimonadota bacterium]|nr:CBS domain-containing protein [bacterium]